MQKSNCLNNKISLWSCALFAITLDLTAASSQCYYPDGSIPNDYVWEPCTGSQYSSCCIPSEGDVCLENGLCYYTPTSQVFRGTCTDQKWNDPACPKDVCITGYESDWTWIAQCRTGSNTSFKCGEVNAGYHSLADCSMPATFFTDNFRTISSSSTTSRSVSAEAVDTALYSVYTSDYTVYITATVQTTTKATVFHSTYTSTLSGALSLIPGTGTETNVISSPTDSGGGGSDDKSSKVTLSTGVLAAVIAGPIVAIIAAIALFLFIRRRRAIKRGDAIRLNSGTNASQYPPPPNGPVGPDQVNPYEVDNTETSVKALKARYAYQPQSDIREVPTKNVYFDGHGEKQCSVQDGAVEVSAEEATRLKNPAPVYTEVPAPVEMDGTSSFRNR